MATPCVLASSLAEIAASRGQTDSPFSTTVFSAPSRLDGHVSSGERYAESSPFCQDFSSADFSTRSSFRTKYHKDERLADCQSGHVYSGRSCATGEKVSIKILSKRRFPALGDLNLARQELELAADVSGHPNVVEVYDCMEDSRRMYLVMELCQGGTLHSYVRERGTLHENEAAHILRQIVSAVAYCHSRGVIHRDVKPENILLKDSPWNSLEVGSAHLSPTEKNPPGRPYLSYGLDSILASPDSVHSMENRHGKTASCVSEDSATKSERFSGDCRSSSEGSRSCFSSWSSINERELLPTPPPIQVKLSDFGLAARSRGVGRLKGIVGSKSYLAPEVLLGEEHTFKVDVWALGVLLYIMLYGRRPFCGKSSDDIFRSILSRDMAHDGRLPVSPEAKRVVDRLLQSNPSERPSAEELLRDRWVNEAASAWGGAP